MNDFSFRPRRARPDTVLTNNSNYSRLKMAKARSRFWTWFASCVPNRSTDVRWLPSQRSHGPAWGHRFRALGLMLVIDPWSVDRKVCFHHRIRPIVRSYEERRRIFEEPTQSRISPSILWYTKQKKRSLPAGQFHVETHKIRTFSSRKFTTQNDRH